MYQSFNSTIKILFSKAAFQLVSCFYAVNAYSQVAFDPANLIFEITLPSETPEFTLTEDLSPEENIALFQAIGLYQEAINTIQLESNSPYNFELLEDYIDLADTYRSLGQHENAIASYRDAVQITKVQNGLYNLDQLPLLQKIIQSYIALGDLDNATLWQEYMQFLHLQNYSAAEMEMVIATFTLTDWYISTFFRANFQSSNQQLEMVENIAPRTPRSTASLAGDQDMIQQFMANPNNAQFNNILNGNIRQISPRDIEHPTLLRVGDMFEQLQENIYASEQPNVIPIIQTARRIAGLSFITKQEMDFEEQNPSFNPNYINTLIQQYRNSQARLEQSYTRGKNALQYIVSLLESIEASSRFLAPALIELGDWHLAYGKIQAAQSAYQEAYSVMASMGISPEEADAALNDSIPRQVPQVATHMFTRRSAGVPDDIDLVYRGYIDVSFNIDELGNIEDIAFGDSNWEDAQEVQRFISSSLRMAKYRPHISNGELISSRSINLRYYYAY